MTVMDNQRSIAQAVRILHGMNLLEVFGHVSARNDNSTCQILGHLHVDGHTLANTIPEDVVTVDFEGCVLEGRTTPPGEVFIHTEIYRRREDVNAVVHAHPMACIALSVVGKEVLPLWVQATPFYQGTPIFVRPEQIDNREIGAEVAELLGNKRAVLLKGHGAVVVGRTVEEACVLAISLERTAMMQLSTYGLGEPVPISSDQLTEGMTRGLSISELVESYWAYWTGRFPLV